MNVIKLSKVRMKNYENDISTNIYKRSQLLKRFGGFE